MFRWLWRRKAISAQAAARRASALASTDQAISARSQKKGAVYGEILFVHQQRLATPLVISNLLVCSPLIRSFAMAIKVFAENC